MALDEHSSSVKQRLCADLLWYRYSTCIVQFPARGSTQVLLCLFPGVLWLWHFLYSVGPHTVSSLHIYTFVVSRAFMAGVASQAGDADSSRAPGLTSGLQGSVNVYRGALLLVPQWQCISSFVFYTVIKNRLSLTVGTIDIWDMIWCIYLHIHSIIIEIRIKYCLKRCKDTEKEILNKSHIHYVHVDWFLASRDEFPGS